MKLSVCLAAYNGELFISDQIASILAQLGDHDELLIGDDCSTDNTVKIILSFNDPRIQIHTSTVNIGCVKNFERLIDLANGDVIFLSDQDDIWENNKVVSVKKILLEYPNVTIVHHALALMDDKGVVYKKWRKNLKEGCLSSKFFLLKQMVRGQMYGCALAFRSSLKPYILPIPENAYAHDDWIALVSGVMGKIYSLNKPLIRYRQHANNYTVKNKLSYVNKVKIRIIQLSLVLQILRRVFVTKFLILARR